jgi:hypothetical protein
MLFSNPYLNVLIFLGFPSILSIQHIPKVAAIGREPWILRQKEQYYVWPCNNYLGASDMTLWTLLSTLGLLISDAISEVGLFPDGHCQCMVCFVIGLGLTPST